MTPPTIVPPLRVHTCVYAYQYDALQCSRGARDHHLEIREKHSLYNVTVSNNKFVDRVKIRLGLLRGYALLYGIKSRLTCVPVRARARI